MPMENQSAPLPELPGTVPQNAEVSFDVPHAAAESRTVPKAAEDFGNIPHATERRENHTLTVRETARMFETAGVARTERSVINWCQPNRQGISRLDSYYDPNERKYYITPQSVEAVIQEEIQRVKKPEDASDSEGFGSSVAHVKHPASSTNGKSDETRRIEELERTVNDLKLSNQVKDLFINLLKDERSKVFEKFLPANQLIGQLETKQYPSTDPQNKPAQDPDN